MKKKLPSQPDHKVCLTCLNEFPATTDHFQVSNRVQCGLSPHCKGCTKKVSDKRPKTNRREYRKQYYETNKKVLNQKAVKKRVDNPQVRAVYNVGKWTWQFMKSKSCRYSKTLGCTSVTLIAHLEAQFDSRMTWETYGHGPATWQIDHIKSLALAYLEGPESFAAACRFENLRPLWWEDHIVKTNNDIRLIREKKSVKST